MKLIRIISLVIIVVYAAYWVVGNLAGKNSDNMAGTETSENAVQIGGEFNLTNQDGEVVASKDLNDKYKLVFFGFTNCPAICPTSMAVITAALQDVDNADDIYPIFISVDPERDNPEQIKTFLENFHPNFIGLTGSVEEIKEVKNKFRVFAKKADIELDGMYDMQHSSIIYMFDENWNYVQHFNHQDSSDRIAQQLNEEL